MKKILVLVLILTIQSGFGQAQMNNATRDQINVNGMAVPTNGTLWGFSSAAQGTTVGETFLDTLWAKGNIKLYEAIQPIGGSAVDTLVGLTMRYNVHFNEVEILLNSYKDTRVLAGEKVQSFWLMKDGETRRFVNAKKFETEKKAAGFFEILVSGKNTLAALHKSTVRKPTYNAAFEVGDKDTKVELQEDFYVLENGKAEKLSLNKKGILQHLNDRAEVVNDYMKVNDLDLKNRSNLIRLFERYHDPK